MTARLNRNISWDEDLERGDGPICSVSDGIHNQPRTSLDDCSPNQDSVSTDDVRALHNQHVESRDFSPERQSEQAESHDEEPSGSHDDTVLVLGPDSRGSLPPQEDLLRTQTPAAVDDESTDFRERDRDSFSDDSSTVQNTGVSGATEPIPVEANRERERMDTSGAESIQSGVDHRSFHLSHHRSALIVRLVPRESNPVAYLQQLAKSILSHMRKSSDTTKGASDTGQSDKGKFRRTEKDKYLEVSFAEMQRMKLRKLQSKLVEHAVNIRCREEEPTGWEDDLKQYTDAIRDYHYMTSFGNSADDPFLTPSMRFIDHFVIQTLIEGEGELEKENTMRTVSVPWAPQNEVRPIIDVRNRHVAEAWVKGFKQRLLMAATGGFFLIGPMWLMVKRNDQDTSLIATTAFVALFGILMARNLDSPKEVMSNTAAYAAVLVVFVGLGGTPST